MLPTNSSKATTKGCVPTSSDCVIWQGPDLDCIKLCRGDSISTVIAKLATELCALMHMFDLTNYDLTCLGLTVSQTPKNAGDLLKILLARICAMGTGIEPELTEDGCPINCTVTIAKCFQYIDTTGTLVTTMDLMDYITAIGNRICGVIDSLAVIYDRLGALETQGGAQGFRITTIEKDKASIGSLQYQLSTFIDPSGKSVFIKDAVRSIENSLIGTQQILGTPSQLSANIVKAGSITTEKKLSSPGDMSSIVGWTDQSVNAAESIGNIWLTLEDMRLAVDYLNKNTIANDCSQINLNFRATALIGSSVFVSIYTDGSLGFNSKWSECNNSTTIVISDSAGNTSTTSAKLLDLITDPTGLQIDITATSIDPSLDLTVTAKSCFYNKSSKVTCEKEYTYLIAKGNMCPSATITVFSSSINYQFATNPGYNYVVNVYLKDSSTLIATQIVNTPGISVNNLIMGLSPGIDYDLQVETLDSNNNKNLCSKIHFTTIAIVCLTPTLAVVTQTIT